MMNRSEQINEIAKALCLFQGEVSNPKKTATNPHHNYNYTPLDEVMNTIKPVLKKHGLSFIQNTWSEGENIVVQTLLMHESGQWLESAPLSLPGHQVLKGGGKVWNAQGAGSAITYGRRYQLSAVLGIASEEDTDAASQHGNNQMGQAQPSGGQQPAPNQGSQGNQGNQGSQGPDMLTGTQLAKLKYLVDRVAKAANTSSGEVERKIQEEMNYTSVKDLTKSRASTVISKLQVWAEAYEKQSEQSVS